MRRAVVALAVGAAAAVGAGSARAESPLEIHTAIDDVRACAVTREGVVLAGTAGGLAVYGADGKLVRVLTALDSLPDTRVHSLLLDGETVWIGTEKGLAKARLYDRLAFFAPKPGR